VVDQIGIVSGIAAHGVGTSTAIDDVGAAVADNHVVQGVAGAVDVNGPGQCQVLHVGGQRMAYRGEDAVGSGTGGLSHQIGGVVDNVAVISRTAHHQVGPGAPVQDVGAAVAGDDIVQSVAGAVGIGGTGERQLLHVVGEGIACRRIHGIIPFPDVLHHGIAAAVHDIGIISPPAGEGVHATVADDGVGIGVAGAIDVGAAGQDQLLDVFRERIGSRGVDGVGTLACVLQHQVGGVVHVIGVVVAHAGEDVHAVVGDHGVGQRVPSAIDVGTPCQDQIFHVVGKCVTGRSIDGVDPL